MKRLYLFILIFLFCINGNAQQNNTGEVKRLPESIGLDAVNLLNETSLYYQRQNVISIDFTCKIVNGNKTIDNSNGSIIIKKKMFVLKTSELEYFCNGKTIYTLQPDINEVSIFDYDEESGEVLNPVELIINWKKNYRAKTIKEITENNKQIAVIDLTPNKQSNFFKIRLFVNKSKKEVIRFAIYSRGDAVTTYTFNKVVYNKPVADNFFELDVKNYPKATINDMR